MTFLIDANTDALQFTEQGSAPATPASGKQRIYYKTDGKFYSKDDTGTETEIGAGSGVDTNHIAAYDFGTSFTSGVTVDLPPSTHSWTAPTSGSKGNWWGTAGMQYDDTGGSSGLMGFQITTTGLYLITANIKINSSTSDLFELLVYRGRDSDGANVEDISYQMVEMVTSRPSYFSASRIINLSQVQPDNSPATATAKIFMSLNPVGAGSGNFDWYIEIQRLRDVAANWVPTTDDAGGGG